MEIVVFHSDIARLVLAYLKNQRLEKASRIFCKTSPHLQQEYTAFKQGLQAYSFFPELEEIIREYVKITRKVEQVVAAMPEMQRPKFQHKKLSQKLNEFIDRTLPVIIAQCGGGSGGASTGIKDDSKPTNISTASCSSVQSDKENKTRKDRKRKRNTDSTNTTNELSAKNETPKKRRRVLEPFCFLSVTRQKAHHSIPPPHSPASSIDQMLSTENDEKNLDESTESQEELDDETDISTDDEEYMIQNVSILEKPTKESTPRVKAAAPTLSEFSQAILDNPQFQQKLVENINQALQTSGCLTANTSKEFSNEVNESARKTRSSTSQATKLESAESEASLATSSQILDQLVKDILANTEKDPTFDAIIHDVVGASNTKPLVSERSNMEGATLTAIESISGVDTISSISSVPPSTPLIIRTIPSNATLNSGDPQALPPSLTANNSFGSLIDPNFSISKLIVLNSNDSAQKQANDPTLGNTTADNLLNQLASQSVTSNELTSIDDQVYFDVNTGQLTLPLFLTNDGLLTNFPFLINNELITQQLQPDNIIDATRIEIPLPEPISFSADQLPPNSIIVGSTQKNETVEGLQRTVCKLQKNATTVPASLDSRMNVERATPSTNGIVNAKAFRSLSTPRKRASHVRTLTFSPRSSTVPSTTTPLSTRRESLSRFQRIQKTIPTQLEQQTLPTNLEQQTMMTDNPEKTKPTNPEVEKIKNVELRSSTKVTVVAAPVADASANESSNSCSVPPLFAMEESSNQTVIKANLPSDLETKPKKPEAKIKMVSETPKRKQLRKTAVRACKRVLSKSAAEEEEAAMVVEKQQEENQKNEGIDLNSGKKSEDKLENEVNLAEDIKQQKDLMMEEWVRMRTATKNDLDSRLREWNSKMMYKRPNQKCVKKLRKKRGKSLAAIAAKTKANKTLEEEQNVSTVQEDTAIAETEAKTTKPTDTNGNSEKTQAKKKPKSKQLKKPGKIKDKAKDPNSSTEFNIKILTPQKTTTSSTELAKKESKTKVKLENGKQEEAKQNVIDSGDGVNQAKVFNSSNESTSCLRSNNPAAKPSDHPLSTQIHSESLELEKRTANIACLLETPFKDTINSISVNASCMPPTPGVFGGTSFETPLSKLKPSTEDMLSHSFLFGSLTKSELETPLLSAITPGGFKFTPFGSKDATPRSVAATEYSSGGGSYYRPDESDDLDRNIDKLLRDSGQKKTANSPERFETKEPETKLEISSGTEVEKNKSLEITAEKLKVEPIVLKRVKSFGSEAADSAVDTLANIDPHYILAGGLPEVSDNDEASSSSSSSSSSATSASSSSSSSSSDTSSASNRSSSFFKSSNNEKNSETVIERDDGRQSLNVSLALDNLSEISSAEDDEWQKLAVSDGENSQLVDNDGEVRYPVRSWLTPSKATNTIITKTAAEPSVSSNPIKVKFPIKISEKRNKHLNELEEKRQRIKSKLKNDSEHKDRAFQSSSVAQTQAATRRLQVAKEVKLKKMQQKQHLQEKQRLPNADAKSCTIDVLTALHLSAKKQPPVGAKEKRLPLEAIPKLHPLGDIDDNAVSNIFDNACQVGKQANKHTENNATLETPKTKILYSPAKPKQAMTKQRKCLPIEAHSVASPRAAKGKVLKKAPARLKTAAPLMPSETTEAEVISAKEPKPSPVPKIKIKSSVGVNVNRQKAKTIYGTKSAKNNRDDQVPTEKMSKPIISKKLKTPVKKPGTKAIPQKQTDLSNKQQQAKQLKTYKAIQDFSAPSETQRENTVEAPIKTKPEQKVAKQHINETENRESTAILPEINTVVESVAVLRDQEPGAAPTSAVPHTFSVQPVNANDDDDDDEDEDEDISDDDDPLKYCKLMSYTEDDGKGHFITLKYKGTVGEVTKQSKTIYDLSNFRMVIAFDEDEQHTLQVSEEYCLFECKPQKQQQAIKVQPAVVRNIPKKRRLRVATTSTSDDSVDSKSAIKSAFTNTSPAASSTPLSATLTTQQKENNDKTTKALAANKEVKIKSLPLVKSTTSSQAKDQLSLAQEKPSTSLAPPSLNTAAEKIQIEDIESILSHLHGK